MTAFLSLFAGIGGFDLGAYWAGLRFDEHYFSEVDPYAIEDFQRRFPDAIPLGDVRKIDGKALADSMRSRCGKIGIQRKKQDDSGASGGSVDCYSCSSIIAGGFPCQDISCAGKGAGITGERSGLWFEYARLIGELRPRYAIMENVGALTRRGIDAVLGSLAEIGYDAEWADIRASDVGAPHRRERIWIVAYPRASQSRGVSSIGWETMAEAWSNGETLAYPENPDGRRAGGTDDSGRRHPEAGRCGIGGTRIPDWSVEPDVGRVAHGVPARVDRLKCLGNAIVPQIAYLIFSQPIFDEWRKPSPIEGKGDRG